MQPRAFHTPLGPIWLTGDAAAFEGDAPVLVGFTGAFATADGAPSPSHLARLVGPRFAAVGARLPGNHCPPLCVPPSIGAYAQAYSAALDAAFPGRDLFVLGASVGGLVAMGLTSAGVRAGMIVEPPLEPQKLWPLREFLRRRLIAPNDPSEPAFIERVFGLGGAATSPVDHRGALAGLRFPIEVLVGDEPLFPVRALQRLPSLLDDEARALIAAHPLARLHEAPNTGHNVLEQAPAFALQTLTTLLSAAVA